MEKCSDIVVSLFKLFSLQCLSSTLSQQFSMKMSSRAINVSVSNIWSIKELMKPADGSMSHRSLRSFALVFHFFLPLKKEVISHFLPLPFLHFLPSLPLALSLFPPKVQTSPSLSLSREAPNRVDTEKSHSSKEEKREISSSLLHKRTQCLNKMIHPRPGPPATDLSRVGLGTEFWPWQFLCGPAPFPPNVDLRHWEAHALARRLNPERQPQTCG